MIYIYKFVGKKDQTYESEYEPKLNSNCPAEEKSGTGPGSCGGASGKSSEKSTTKPSKISNIADGKLESSKLGNLKYPKRALSGAKQAAMYTDISPKDWKKMTPENKQSWAKSEAESQIGEWALDAGWPYNSDEEDVMAKEIASEFIKIMDTGKRPSMPRRKKTAGDYAQYD